MGFCLEPLDTDTVLFSLLYSRLYLRNEAGPGQETKGLAKFAVYGQHGVYCMFRFVLELRTAICMVNGSRGAKKQWYKDALQLSLTG